MSESRKTEPENQEQRQDSNQEQERPSAEQDTVSGDHEHSSGMPEPPDDPSLLSDEEDDGASAANEAAQESGEAVETDTPPESPDSAAEPTEDAAATPTNGGDGSEPPPTGADPDEDGEKDDDEEKDEEDSHEGMSFFDHMNELRVRLVRCLIAAGVGFLACYGFHNELFALLMEPLVKVFPPGSSLIYTGLPEAFFTYIKVSMVAGILLTSPYIFYQIWSFIAPGLYREEKKYLIPIALCSGLFFAAGAIFGYSVVFPFAFGFFMEFATETIKPMPSLKEYLSFSLKLLFAFGVTFEMPLFAFFLGKLGIITARMMRKFRKYAFLCAFVVAAVLTPPDIISQMLMAGPLIVLFEVSIWVVQIFGRQPKQKKEDEEEEEAEAAADEAASE